MRKLAIAITKGGTGKSTAAVNLAAGLARAGRRVLLIDTDTQGQAGSMLGVAPSPGLAPLMDGDATPEDAVVEARPGLDLLAGGHALAGLKRNLSRLEFGGEKVLSQALAPLERHYEYFIVDTAPGWDALTVNVLFCAQELLSPVSMEVLSLQGLVEFEKRIRPIQKYNPGLELQHILPTLVDGRVKKSAEILEQLQSRYQQRLCASIRYNVRVSEAPGHGQTIFEYAPRSTGAQDYQRLVERIEDGAS